MHEHLSCGVVFARTAASAEYRIYINRKRFQDLCLVARQFYYCERTHFPNEGGVVFCQMDVNLSGRGFPADNCIVMR